MSLNSVSSSAAAVVAILEFCPFVATMQLAPVSQNVTFLFVVSCLCCELASAVLCMEDFNKRWQVFIIRMRALLIPSPLFKLIVAGDERWMLIWLVTGSPLVLMIPRDTFCGSQQNTFLFSPSVKNEKFSLLVFVWIFAALKHDPCEGGGHTHTHREA